MPRDDYVLSIPQRRCASAVRGGARFAPYAADVAGLKAHATCPEFYNLPSNNTPPPEAPLDPSIEVSSVATLVNSTFDQDKIDSPGEFALDKSSKSSDKKAKFIIKSSIQQKKFDHFVLLIDVACKIMTDVWPQTAIPTIFRLQSGASYGYSPETRGMSVNDFPASQSGSDLVNLKKFITELLKRSRSTVATFQTALCYLEAIRPKIPEIQQAEVEGKGTRGEPVDHAIGRIVIDPNYVAVAEEENRKLARNNSKCKLRKPHVEPGFTLPDLPSPLLCPRRTLMGALVLAAKFVQDKCYSNRAWAKLCGLPPREVGRCERALGDALGWRLWVGREMLNAFGGSDLKLERTSTAFLTSNLGEELKAVLPASFDKSTLTRAATWSPTAAQLPQPLRPADTEIIFSPVPSLVTSSGSGSSNWPSGNLSPSVPSPLPLFVSNDPSPLVHNKLPVANLIHTDTIRGDTNGYDYGRDENAFDIRVGNGQELY